tara:strand:+ start:405 stop:2297 length:1893 start_codon:yes stop_codon:yes gene_type:complete
MPLKKIELAPGINRENTRYATEGGWYEGDKIRFRQGTPEKIGGWERISTTTFLGVCRSLWNWVTIGGQNLVGVGTNLKFYIERGGFYYDVTPIRATTAAGDVTFAAVNGSSTLTVADTAHGAAQNDFVTFSGAVSLGGNITAAVLNQEYQVLLVVDENSYTITAKDTAGATVTANASDTGNGGGVVVGEYQITTGSAIGVPFTGWGAGAWGSGTWGTGGTTTQPLRLWSQTNFGEDLVFAYRGGPLLYWDASTGTAVRGKIVDTTNYPTSSDVPTAVNYSFVSDISRFVFAFGANALGETLIDPMLIRWSDQESFINWTPDATNQAGSLKLSHGTEIVTATQARQEILIWSDSAIYSLQYLGYPDVWGAQLLGDNISIAGQNATVYAAGVAFWMGRDKFYTYDGTVMPLPSNVRRYVFSDINSAQYAQVCAGTNEGFNEVWWFYCSSGSTTNDRYVVYNYVENLWFYGTLGRTAWLDSGLRAFPLAATYNYNLVNHEVGTDDNETAVATAITASVTSSEFDLEDGHQFAFIRRVLPDVTFTGSTAGSPALTMSLLPLQNSGSGYNSPLSEGGDSSATVTRIATVPIEEFTGQAFVRVRGRQLAVKIESTALGVAWQLGAPRLDIRPDGRR